MPYPVFARDHDEARPSSGAHDLLVAVLLQALEDCRHPDDNLRRDVHRFLRDGSLEFWGNLLGLHEAVVTALRNEMARRLAADPETPCKARRLTRRLYAQREGLPRPRYPQRRRTARTRRHRRVDKLFSH
jgi:hypothetical protein